MTFFNSWTVKLFVPGPTVTGVLTPPLEKIVNNLKTAESWGLKLGGELVQVKDYLKNEEIFSRCTATGRA